MWLLWGSLDCIGFVKNVPPPLICVARCSVHYSVGRGVSVISSNTGMPGPGSYATYLEWSRGVSFTRSSRMSQHQDEIPAPDTYGNLHHPSRHRAVPVFGPKVAPSSQSSTANTVQSSTVNVPYVSREALERAVALTRPPTARPCSFPRAARFRESSTDESFRTRPLLTRARGLSHPSNLGWCAYRDRTPACGSEGIRDRCCFRRALQ